MSYAEVVINVVDSSDPSLIELTVKVDVAKLGHAKWNNNWVEPIIEIDNW